MKIENVRIAGFKNLKNLQLEFGSGVNGFWGENGQGKSNLLEALYACVKGTSFRPYSHRGDWIPDDGTPLSVHLDCRDDVGLLYQCELFYESTSQSWVWKLNDKKTRVMSLAEKIPIVVFSPDDHALIREGPEHRRSFLDTVLIDVCPGYSEVLARFDKVLKSRNRLLKQYQRDDISDFTPEMDTWSRTLAVEAEGVAMLRREVWPRFEGYFQQVAGPLFEALSGSVGLQFEQDSVEKGRSFDKIKYYQILKDEYRKDLATGWTHRGPHRDDFKTELGGIDARSKASQGQARLLALSLKWTHALWVSLERREIPLFLIDDFSNELDILRRKKLLEMLGQISGQILITGTDSNTILSANFTQSRHFTVKRGEISPT
ncbi:MAG: DNA replication and repair protein RecF [Bdellovibrionota bacterium]